MSFLKTKIKFILVFSILVTVGVLSCVGSSQPTSVPVPVPLPLVKPIIQVQGLNFENYQTVSLGDSDNIHVGDIVLAIGAPFGLAQTVTHGIISATGRADVGIADYEDFLQTDAPINPGNSGGPLVNVRGEVIGMNSAIATSSGQSGGVAFSIPSNMIKSMLPKIIKGQAIIRGEIGIVIQNLTEEIAQHFGLKDT
jgi:serine protease Do